MLKVIFDGLNYGVVTVDTQRSNMADVDTILESHEPTHGHFPTQGHFAQELKEMCRRSPNWHSMSYYQREALEMIMHKASRILFGTSNEIDHWDDIAGYAKLVSNELEEGKIT
jgi:hypothetical protein